MFCLLLGNPLLQQCVFSIPIRPRLQRFLNTAAMYLLLPGTLLTRALNPKTNYFVNFFAPDGHPFRMPKPSLCKLRVLISYDSQGIWQNFGFLVISDIHMTFLMSSDVYLKGYFLLYDFLSFTQERLFFSFSLAHFMLTCQNPIYRSVVI